jgi:hypothetical protein
MADKRTPSLDGLIQIKGATRPDGLESPARALQATLATGIQPSPVLSSAEREPRAKSLTLRLSESQYERLRRFAFERRLSHQDVIERALMACLDQQDRKT